MSPELGFPQGSTQPGGASRVCPALSEGPGHRSGVVSITLLLSAQREGPEIKAVLGSTSAALQTALQLPRAGLCREHLPGESWLLEPPKPPFSPCFG